LWPVSFVYDKVDTGHGTHLTVDRTCGVKTDQYKDYGHEGGYSCERVNLRKV